MQPLFPSPAADCASWVIGVLLSFDIVLCMVELASMGSQSWVCSWHATALVLCCMGCTS